MKRKEQPFFIPDDIATHVHQALQLDLSDEVLAYSSLNAPLAFLATRQRDEFLKKYCSSTVDSKKLEQEAYTLFNSVNASMKEFNAFPFPDPDKRLDLSLNEKILLSARFLAHYVLGRFDEEEFLQSCNNSSGTSVGVNYSDTSQEAKFKSPISCTKGVDQWFKWYLNWDSRLSETLELKGPITFEIVEGSKATTVPKDNTKVRMICVEPTLNMFFQQGLMQAMSRRLKKVGLSFESLQVTHRELAAISSITGINATIDWSSASDCVSNGLVKWLLPRDWYYYANVFRSKKMSINGIFTELEMFSTMGNATTFPIETLVFWTLAVASHYHRVKRTSLLVPETAFKSCSTFGDDCIVPAASADRFISICQLVGFRVNTTKTFLTGPFRESCGGDYHSGVDVRPFFLKGPTSNSKMGLHAWVNIIINRIITRSIQIWGTRDYVYRMHHTFSYLFALFKIHGLELNLVPTYYPEDSGIKLFGDLARVRRCYKLRPILSKITIDRHGTRRFRYISFKYDVRLRTWADLRYALKLKFPVLEPAPFLPVRRKGGYVVATGLSPAFHIV